MISVIDTCCDKPSDLPVYPPRVFEHIPDEIPFVRDLPTIDNEMYPPSSVDQQTKPVLRNRLILLGAMIVFVVYFQTYTSKKRS